MANKIAGTCYIKVDGEQLEVKGSVEVPLSEKKRENVMGLNGSAGFKEMAQEPYVNLTALFTSGFPLSKITTGTDLTITAELANGKVYTLTGGFLTDPGPVKAEDGELELKFSGTRGEFQ